LGFTLDIPRSRRLGAALGRIDRFRDAFAGSERPPAGLTERLVAAGRVRSVASACRLTGLRVGDGEVAAVLADGGDGANETELRACDRAFDTALAGPAQLLEVTDLGRINGLLACIGNGHNGHGAAIAGAGDDGPSAAPLRAEPLLGELFDADGRATGRIVPTLPPRMLAGTLDDLVTWLEYELRDRKLHPLLAIGGFTLGLLAAAPFARRNTRTTLVLVDLLLRRAGHDWIACGSVVAGIEERRDLYNDAFDASRTRLWTGHSDSFPWLEFLVDVVDRERERIAARVELERGSVRFPPLQRSIVETVRRHGVVDASLLMRATGANRNTLKDNLRRLVDSGVLERSGQRRGTRYRLATPADLLVHSG